jgi:hypothetical protein
MGITIIIDVRSTPEQLGYLDRISVLENDELVYHDDCSTCPNPYKPKDIRIKWKSAYAWISCGEYEWSKYLLSQKHSPCLILNSGGAVPTRFPNLNHFNRLFATEIMIHSGQTDQWRGSAGCITIPPKSWGKFISLFWNDDSGKIIIREWQGNEKK